MPTRLGLMPYSAADFLGDRTGHNDGHGVIGGGDVHKAPTSRPMPSLAAALAPEHLVDGGQQCIEAAVGPDQPA